MESKRNGWVLLVLFGALLACKGKKGKQEAYAKELTDATPRACTATAVALDGLNITCNKYILKDDMASTRESIITKLKSDCSTIQAAKFSSITLSADGFYETEYGNVEKGDCEPKSK